MKKSEFRKYLKSMSEEQKDELIVELYNRQAKKDRELVELIMTGIREGKDLPDPKAEIPDLKKAKKQYEEYFKRMHMYAGWRRGRSRAKFRSEAKELIRQLSLTPPRSQEYEEAYELFGQLFLLFSLGQAGWYPWPDLFGDLATTQSRMYHQLCSLALAGGTKVRNLQYLTSILAKSAVSSPADTLEMALTLLGFMKNGDLKSEIVWQLEDLIRQEEKKFAQAETTQDRSLALKHLKAYSLTCLAIGTSIDGEEQALKNWGDLIESPGLKSEIRDQWNKANRILDARENDRISTIRIG